MSLWIAALIGSVIAVVFLALGLRQLWHVANELELYDE